MFPNAFPSLLLGGAMPSNPIIDLSSGSFAFWALAVCTAAAACLIVAVLEARPRRPRSRRRSGGARLRPLGAKA